MIDTAKTAYSKGICAKCGANKQFKNSTDIATLAWRNSQAAMETHHTQYL
jgi:hypothetical protein